MAGMEDLRNLEKQKNEEMARLQARHAELESLMHIRRMAYAREMEQIKDFMSRAVKNLETAFHSKESAAKNDLENTRKEMGGLEEKLSQIGKEADWDVLERKLHSIEESFASEVKAPKISEYPSKLQEELSLMRREAEARLSAKASEIAAMNGKIRDLERAAEQEQEEFERRKDALQAEGRLQLEKRESELRAVLTELDRELAKRQLRIGELEKLIAARENWVEHEKTRRLERIKSLAEDLDKHAKLLEEKIEQEKGFWRNQIANTTKEAEALNARLATAQAELQALKNHHYQEMQSASVEAKKQAQQREAQVREQLEVWKEKLRAANSQMHEMTGRYEAIRAGYEKEISDLEASFTRQKAELGESIRQKELELENTRENSSSELAKRMAELNALRAEYERKILTPILEEKGRHLRELEDQKRAVEQEFAQQEEAHRREISRLTQEYSEMEAKIAELEKSQMAESRAHQDRARSLREEAVKALAPLNEKLGELSKSLELTRKKYADEMERLDREKANVAVEVDHKRIAFETAVEEKRKDILFGIENLKASQEGSQARRLKERENLSSSCSQLRAQLEKLQSDMARQRESNERTFKVQQEEMERAQAKSSQEIERLKESIARAGEEGEIQVRRMRDEIAQLQEQGSSLMESLAKAWQAEELELEKRRIVLMEEINKTAEIHANEKKVLEAEASRLHSALESLQKQSSAEEEKWTGIFAELEKRRQAVLGPLESQLSDLSRRQADILSKNKARAEELGKQIQNLRSDLEHRRGTYAKEIECRREALASALEELRERRKKEEMAFLQTRERLARDNRKSSEEIERREAEMKKAGEAHLRRRQELERELDEERAKLEGSLAQSQEELRRTREEMEQLDAARIRELDQIEEKIKLVEEEYRTGLLRLEEQHRAQTAETESRAALAAQALQKEIAELNSGNEAQAVRLKELVLEADVLKNRREMELVDLERRKRRLAYEMRSKRNELARELRLGRRAAQDKLREQEHNLYLARMKFQVRSKRLDENMAARRQELSRFRQAADARLMQSLKNLESQAAALRERKLELQRQIKAAESAKENQVSQSPEFRSLENLERDKEAVRRRAKERLESFLSYVEKLIAEKESEKRELLKMIELMGPFGEGLQRSFTGLSMDWERELRRVENLIKGIEENPIWRQP